MPVSFITVLNGVITGKHHGDLDAEFYGTPYHGHERIVVPFEAAIAPMEPVTFYNPDWKRKTDCCLIAEGLLPMPTGYIQEDDQLRPMTQGERIAAGLDELPQGMKFVDGQIIPMTQVERITEGLDELPAGMKIDGDRLIPMTLLEQLTAGQITQEEYEQILTEAGTRELNRRLAELQTPEIMAQVEVDPEYAAARKAKIIALLAVKNQPGWPVTIEWPE